MGKRLEAQRRGKGSQTFQATQSRQEARYPTGLEKKETRAEVVQLIKDSGRHPVLAQLEMEDHELVYTLAPEGLWLGQEVRIGRQAELKIGNILPLEKVPEGCPVFNVEKEPGDGGRFARASGSFAVPVEKGERVGLKLPSGKIVYADPRALATIGCSSSGERTEKPFVKAGKKHHQMRAINKLWPMPKGVERNAVDHPFGGSQHHPGKSKSVSRHAPPGRKVGSIASSRTGRRKKN